MIKPKKTLENIESYRVEPFARPWLMKLDANENYLGPSPKVIERLKNLNPKEISQYPCYGELYEKIAELNGVDEADIAVTNGADEALSAIINTYLTAEDTLVTVKPSFSMPKIYSAVIGANYKEVPYQQKWTFPQESFLETVDDNTKIILITSPNNPTGDIVSLEFIKDILNLHKDKLLVVDETYSTYAQSTCAHLTKRYDNLAVVRSFSKDYALAGLRIGCIISNEINIKNIKKVLSPYTVNNIASIAVQEALSDKNYINFIKTEIDRSKKYLQETFEAMGISVYPSYANFLLADFGEKSDSIFFALKKNNIIVKRFTDPMLKSCLRITVPSLMGAEKIIEVLNPKKVIVFDMDGVLIDVSDSYRFAIEKTYEKFSGISLSAGAIQQAKNQGGLNNDWELTKYLLSLNGITPSYKEIVDEFQKIYWNDGNGAINNERLLVKPEILKMLSQNYSLAIFTGRPKHEAEYTLKKFDIEKYFSKIITMDDLPNDRQKPDTLGLELIRKSMWSRSIIYLGDTVDDMRCAKDFKCKGVGVLPPSDKSDGLKDLLFVSGAKYVINEVNDIANLLERMNENS